MKKTSLTTGLDGDDGRAGLAIPTANNRRRISSRRPAFFQSCRFPKRVSANKPRTGNFAAQLGHGDADIADISASGELQRMKFRQPARSGWMAQIHRLGNKIGED